MQFKGVELVKQQQVQPRHAYDGLQDQISQLSGLSCENDPGLTKQADKEACDINNILKRYQKTGILPDLIKREPRYGDFSDIGQYQDALERVTLAQEQFNALDAHVRKRFDNDPAKFLAFATDSKNNAELIKMGLATRKQDSEASTPSQPKPASGEASSAVSKDGKAES